MTTPLETAFPLASNFVAATIRAKLAEQGIGCFSTAALSAENFTIQPWSALAIFGGSGALELYAYDAADTTTADDGGVSCIVVSGRRYKKRIDVIVRDAALSATLTAQPASPSLGDTYIVPAAPSGSAWASKAKTVATFTARGWIFRTPFIGMVVYVSGSDSFYRYTSGGVWAQGLGSAALPDGSVVPKKLANPFALFKVEDQRNAPPGGTPTVGTCYQVGTSPTGAFAGQGNRIARWNEGATWEFFAAAEGDTIYRKDVGLLYSYRSGVWVRTVPASVVEKSYYVDDVSVATSTDVLTNRLSSPPVTAAVGQKIRVTVDIIAISGTTTGGQFSANVGIRVDTSGAISKTMCSFPVVGEVPLAGASRVTVAEIPVSDTSSHVYHIATVVSGGSGTRRILDCTMRAIFEVITPT